MTAPSGIYYCRRLALAFGFFGCLFCARAAEQPPAISGLIAVLKGHTEAIYAVDFSPDGNQVVTGSADKTLKLWDSASGKEIKTFGGPSGHQNMILSAAFSPDGQWLASGSQDNTVKLWDVPMRTPVKEYGQPDTISAWSLSPDGNRLAIAGKDHAIKVLNTADGKQALNLTVPAGPVTQVTFSPNGQIVAAAAKDGVRWWNAGNGQSLSHLPIPTAAAKGLVFHPNNTTVFTLGDDGVLATWQLPIVPPKPGMKVTPARALPGNAGPIRCFTITPSGSHLLTGGNKELAAWNTATGAKETRAFPPGTGPVQALAISKNNVLVAAGWSDQTVRLYQWADGKPISQIKVPAPIKALAFSPNQQLLVAACLDKSLIAWNVAYNPGQPIPAEFGKPLESYHANTDFSDVVFHPDSSRFFAGGGDKTIKVWKIAAEAAVKSLAHPNLVDVVAFHPAGSLLATGCHDGIVRIWDVAKGQVQKQIAAHTTPAPAAIYCLAWSKDGNQLVSGSLDRSLKLWDANKGTLIREFKGFKPKDFEKGHREGVFCVALSPVGPLLASGGSDHAIKLWNLSNGTVLRDFTNSPLKSSLGALPVPPPPHPGWVYSLRFTPDGKYLVSAGNAPRNQGFLALWSVADGKLVVSAILPTGVINSLAMSADGKRLALGCGSSERDNPDGNGYILKMP